MHYRVLLKFSSKKSYIDLGDVLNFFIFGTLILKKIGIMSVNKVILLGNVGKDPEVRYLDTGIAVATFSLATTEKGYTLNNGTHVPDRTEWHNLVLWRGLAEIAEKYVHKGDKLYVEGKIKSRSYEDQSGNKRYITEIFVDNMEMLSARSTQSSDQQVSQQTSPTAASTAQKPAAGGEDLPF